MAVRLRMRVIGLLAAFIATSPPIFVAYYLLGAGMWASVGFGVAAGAALQRVSPLLHTLLDLEETFAEK